MDRALPFWFSPDELEKFSDFLRQDSLDLEKLDDYRLEIDVAKLRIELLTIKASSLSQALGLPDGAVPVYFTEKEKVGLLALNDLPEILRNRLK